MQAAQQAFAIQKAYVVPGLKDVPSLQACKSWGNQSSKMPSWVPFVDSKLVCAQEPFFVNPLHSTFSLRWARSEICVMWAELRTKQRSSLPISAHLERAIATVDFEHPEKAIVKGWEAKSPPSLCLGGMVRSYIQHPRDSSLGILVCAT